MSDGMMILIVFSCIILIPLGGVFLVLGIVKTRHKKKEVNYKGYTEGIISKIVDTRLEHPGTIYVEYKVNGMTYEVHETLKLKSEAIKVGGIPMGQKKTYVLGAIKVGDVLPVLYDEEHPQKAMIQGNDGLMNV